MHSACVKKNTVKQNETTPSASPSIPPHPNTTLSTPSQPRGLSPRAIPTSTSETRRCYLIYMSDSGIPDPHLDTSIQVRISDPSTLVGMLA